MSGPIYEAGAFHVEIIDDAFGIYDAYVNRVHLYFADLAEAQVATAALAQAADVSADELDAEYARQLPLARASMAAA